jgi:hypothetical protein
MAATWAGGIIRMLVDDDCFALLEQSDDEPTAEDRRPRARGHRAVSLNPWLQFHCRGVPGAPLHNRVRRREFTKRQRRTSAINTSRSSCPTTFARMRQLSLQLPSNCCTAAIGFRTHAPQRRAVLIRSRRRRGRASAWYLQPKRLSCPKVYRRFIPARRLHRKVVSAVQDAVE